MFILAPEEDCKVPSPKTNQRMKYQALRESDLMKRVIDEQKVISKKQDVAN